MCDDDSFMDSLDHDFGGGWVSARKAHRCEACGEQISAGHRYHRGVQKYEGQMNTFRHCARCWALVECILAAGASSVQWDLRCGVSWQEAFEKEPPDEVAALAFMTQDEAQVMAGPWID